MGGKMKKRDVYGVFNSGDQFEILLTAERTGSTFNQRFTNLHEYLVKAQELEEIGFKITSWYDKTALSRLS